MANDTKTNGSSDAALQSFLSDSTEGSYQTLDLNSVGNTDSGDDSYDDSSSEYEMEQDAPVYGARDKTKTPAKTKKAAQTAEEEDLNNFLQEDDYEEELTEEDVDASEEEEGGEDPEEQEDSEEDTAAVDDGEGSEESEGRDGEDEEEELLAQSKKESRIPKRIGQLIQKLKEKDTAFSEKEYQYIEALQKLHEENIALKSSSASSLKAAAEAKAAEARRAFKEAAEIGDVNAQLAAQEELTDAKAALLEAERIAAAVKGTQAPVKLTPQQVIATNKAREWAAVNGEVLADPRIQKTALRVSNTLLAEGFEDASDEYWDELNKRINTTIKSSGLKVRVKGIYTDESDDSFMETPQSKAVKKVVPKGKPVKKMAPSLKTPPRKKASSITLDNGDEAFIRNTNVPKELFLRQKAAVKTRKTSEGYTPVIL